MQTSFLRTFRWPAVVLACAALLSACGGTSQDAPQTGAPPPAVTVMTVQAESLPMVTALPGRTVPFLIAELRPQVSGIIMERNFDEGSDIQAGQVLYRIDPASYQAAHDSARAGLARAEANLYASRLTADRYAELSKTNAISRQANDEAAAALRQAQADVEAARAALNKARIDLDFTELKAPIAGRIGRSSVTPGALVTANQAQALAIVQQLDPIYVDLTQSSTEMLRLRRELRSGLLRRAPEDTVPVNLMLEDGSEYAITGSLAFSEVSVNEDTGSVTLRAVFPNPDGELLPGMYVRARLMLGMRNGAVRVPHAAVSRDPRGQAVVMVVDGEDKVEARVVQVAQSEGDTWVVTDGLKSGERVIVEGLQWIRPGMTVQANEAAPPSAPLSAVH